MRARRRVKKDPLETAIFFIDRSVGKKTVATPLREAGLKVEVHDDHFPQDAPDQEWLTEAGHRRWCVITRDGSAAPSTGRRGSSRGSSIS